jgi:CheY-like chemotaxis protein
MKREEIYKIIQTISVELSREDESLKPMAEDVDWNTTLEELGLDIISAQAYFNSLDVRIPSKNFRVPPNLIEKLHLFKNLGELCDYLVLNGFEKTNSFEIVYVDDEPENLFVFRRSFGKDFNLKCFESPTEALEYIKKTPDVKLVITDEVMPEMHGNQLRDLVAACKPHIKFLLITGNPEGDSDLMYTSLAQNRFYDFLQKPVDYVKNNDRLKNLFKSLASE